jgi:putative membrane protein
MYKTIVIATGVAMALAGGAAAATKLTDPQIAHIAYTADNMDIENAKQALDKSKNEQVLQFAHRMIADHGLVNDQALALVQKLNVTPEDNPTSQSIKSAQDASRQKLASLSGAAFDKAYADNEAAYHKAVDDSVRDTLIPNAQNAELKSLLENALKIFVDHQHHAERLAKQLSAASQG